MPKSKNDKPAAKAPVKKAAPAPAKAAPAASTRAPVKRDPKVNSHHGSNHTSHTSVLTPPRQIEIKDPFLKRQKDRLLQLRDSMLDSMMGVAKDNLRTRAEGSEASAFGMHQADAGSDAYDRDFALSLLSQEQDALYEIEEALKRIDLGTYGVCEMCGKPIPHARLEALPFARYTVECQSQTRKARQSHPRPRPGHLALRLTDRRRAGGKRRRRNGQRNQGISVMARDIHHPRMHRGESRGQTRLALHLHAQQKEPEHAEPARKEEIQLRILKRHTLHRETK